MALGLTQTLREMSTSNISGGQRRPVGRADNFTTFMRKLSWNVGASISWKLQGLSRPVMRLLYILHQKRLAQGKYLREAISRFDCNSVIQWLSNRNTLGVTFLSAFLLQISLVRHIIVSKIKMRVWTEYTEPHGWLITGSCGDKDVET